MSRVGKKPIMIPKGTTVVLDSGLLTVKGPLGDLSRKFKSNVEIVIADDVVTLTPKRKDLFSRVLWGTYASHVSNMIEGVNKLFEKKLVIEGIGFKAELKADKLVMNLGFSHPVEFIVPSNLNVIVEKNIITVSGLDKESVGQFSAKVREVKKPEPYKGKGIHYSDERVRRKQGKRST